MIRWVVDTSLKLRYFVVIIAAGVIIIGIVQLSEIPVAVYPEINPPLVEIQTEALGLSAIEMEALITLPLEADLLNGVAWLEQIYSETVFGMSSILLVFEPGTDPIDARQMVQERLTETFALPNVSKPPTMLQPLSSTSRVMMVGLNSDELSLIDMGVLARWNIRPRLMGVPGVANVAIWGLREWQLQVQVDPLELQEAGVTLTQIIETTGEALWVSPLSYLESSSPGTAGWIDTPNQRLGIRHLLPISSANEMAQLPVRGTAYLLGDVATIVEDHQPLIGDALVNEGPGLLLVIEKFPGANILEVTQGIEEALRIMSPGLTGIEIDTTVFRPATYLEHAANNLLTTFLISAALLIIILGVFYNDWRFTLISLITIVFSLISATYVLYLRGVTFNLMVLAGLATVIGIIVDDVIIDIDNIRKKLSAHNKVGSEKSSARAILEGSLEMRGSIGFPTLIILLIILPMFLFEGRLGSFLDPLVVTYTLGIFVALLTALVITPGLCLTLLSNTKSVRRESRLIQKLKTGYQGVLTRTIQSPTLILIITGVIFIASLLVLPTLKTAFLPELKQTNLRIQWNAPPSTSRAEMNRITALVTNELQSIPGVTNIGSHVGRAITGDAIVGINSGELWLSLDPSADYDITATAVRDVIAGYPGVFREVQNYQPEGIEGIFAGTGQELVVRIYGPDFDVLNSKAIEVQQGLLGVSNITEVNIDTLVEEPQIEIEVNLAAAERFQISPGDVRRSATTLLSGLLVGNLYEEQKVFDVVVWGVPEIRQNLTDVGNLLIDTPNGGHVLLSEVADVRINSTPVTIKRDAVSRFIDLTVVVNGRSLSATAADIDEALKNIPFPFEFHAEVLDGYIQEQATQQRILIISVIAVIGSFLLMQAAFRSWRLAFFTLLTWPVTLAGGVLAIFLAGRGLSLGSLIGLLAVLGIAIRNSMLLIDHFQRLEDDEGVAFGPELVLRGMVDRITSILMTALTMALIFLPVIFIGNVSGLEMLHPIAVVVVGGLLTATLLNLFILPVVYLRFGSNREPDPGLIPAIVTGD